MSKPEVFGVVWIDLALGPLTLTTPDRQAAIDAANGIRERGAGKVEGVRAVHVPAGTDTLVDCEVRRASRTAPSSPRSAAMPRWRNWSTSRRKSAPPTAAFMPTLPAPNMTAGHNRKRSFPAMQIDATYSPEDNKIRLYASSRLDPETYERVKAAGFRWAPKQELFVAPAWSPKREDLAIDLAGEIEPEEMTMAERATAKAERLDDLAHKRHRQANAYNRAAQQISERFAMGQPILVGHHSERKARKDQERMQSAMTNANKAAKLADYWLYRATGVERHANYKNDPRVRANRIKTLLAELRDLQRTINHAHLCLAMWEKITQDEAIKIAVGRRLETGPMAHWDMWGKVESGEVTPQDARTQSMDDARHTISSARLRRWIEHTLNRLSYERELLGPVERYEGELTPVILQAFAREHGAHKPEGRNIDGETFVIESSAALPLHLANDTMLELTADEWRDLMQSTGYEVPEKKDAKAPILNLKCKALQARHRYHRDQIETFPVVEMTKAEYGKIYHEQRGTRPSLCGEFRFKICPNPRHEGPRYMAGWCAVFLTDSKAHPLPDSVKALETAEPAE